MVFKMKIAVVKNSTLRKNHPNAIVYLLQNLPNYISNMLLLQHE